VTTFSKLFLVGTVVTLFSLLYLMVVDTIVTLPFQTFIRN
jgi:hypothetical protein